jgi:hypothetical protein
VSIWDPITIIIDFDPRLAPLSFIGRDTFLTFLAASNQDKNRKIGCMSINLFLTKLVDREPLQRKKGIIPSKRMKYFTISSSANLVFINRSAMAMLTGMDGQERKIVPINSVATLGGS